MHLIVFPLPFLPFHLFFKTFNPPSHPLDSQSTIRIQHTSLPYTFGLKYIFSSNQPNIVVRRVGILKVLSQSKKLLHNLNTLFLNFKLFETSNMGWFYQFLLLPVYQKFYLVKNIFGKLNSFSLFFVFLHHQPG